MGEFFITIIIIGIGYLICKAIPEQQFNKRVPPSGYETDWRAMTNDLVSGKSKTEVVNKSNRRGYDVPKNK